MAQRIPLAWKQLTFERMKMITALSGVMVAVLLMWVQLGILAALYASATVLHRSVRADLVVIHPQSENLTKMKPFSVRTLYRLRGYPEVTELGEFRVASTEWRNPDTGGKRMIVMYGLDPDGGWFALPGVDVNAALLRREDTLLFDRNSKNVFGAIIPRLTRGEPFTVEMNGRTIYPIGLTSVASSFGQEGSVVVSRENFLRLSPSLPAEQLHVGLVRVRPGTDPLVLREHLRRDLAPEALVLTPDEFVDFELRYWKSNAPVGFVFTMGTVVGFFVGFIVVYQILYTDVSNHLPQFATMKAMGFTDNFLLRLVIRQGLLLAVVGYIPGSLLAIGLYQVIQAGTGIAVTPTWERAGLLFGLTVFMCLLSGAAATRRLRAADPADVF